MWLILTGLLLWAFLAALAWRLIRSLGRPTPLSRPEIAAALLILALGAAVLCRPHEWVLPGQDPGVYLSTAGSIARKGTLFHRDELLAAVPLQSRGLFMYSHLGYGFSKDSCFEVRDPDTLLMAPRFPPLFPILLAVPMRLFGVYSGLLVTPVLTILAGLALWALARQVLRPRPIALAAPLLYYALPLVAWHGRAPRAEIAASLMTLGALALLLSSPASRAPGRRTDALLAALALALAPLFHVSAWFAVLPITAVSGLGLLAGRRRFVPVLPAAALGVALFIGQTLCITDHYDLRRFLPISAIPPWILAAGLCAIACALAWSLPRLGMRLHLDARIPAGATLSLRARIASAALLAGVILAIFLTTPPIAGRAFTGYEHTYAHPTDLRLASLFLSPAIAALALAGLLWMCLKPDRPALRRILLIAMLLPSALLMGRMYDLFMTRYMVPALCPLVALGLASLCTLIPPLRIRPALLMLAVALLVGGITHGRTAMLTLREQQGMARLLESFAGPVATSGGILLGEYTRTAAPFEHLFGIPVLSFDNETRFDYRDGLDAWRDLMTAMSPRPAFFLTPFGPPISSQFSFQEVRRDRLEYAALPSGRYQLPGRPVRGTLNLTLYRIIPHPPASSATPPYVRVLDAGNMGLAGFSRLRTIPWNIPGIPLAPDVRHTLPLRAPITLARGTRLLAYVLSLDSTQPVRLTASISGAKLAARTYPLAEGWSLIEWNGPEGLNLDSLSVQTDAPLLLNALRAVDVDTGSGSSLLPPGTDRHVEKRTFTGRWSRADAAFVIPTPRASPTLVSALALASDKPAPETTLSLDSDLPREECRIPGERWTWVSWVVPSVNTPDPGTWLRLHSAPAWNSGLPGYPTDLGVQIAQISALPITSNDHGLYLAPAIP